MHAAAAAAIECCCGVSSVCLQGQKETPKRKGDSRKETHRGGCSCKRAAEPGGEGPVSIGTGGVQEEINEIESREERRRKVDVLHDCALSVVSEETPERRQQKETHAP